MPAQPRTVDGLQTGQPVQEPQGHSALLLAPLGTAEPASCWGQNALPTAHLGWPTETRSPRGLEYGVDTTKLLLELKRKVRG